MLNGLLSRDHTTVIRRLSLLICVVRGKVNAAVVQARKAEGQGRGLATNTYKAEEQTAALRLELYSMSTDAFSVIYSCFITAANIGISAISSFENRNSWSGQNHSFQPTTQYRSLAHNASVQNVPSILLVP